MLCKIVQGYLINYFGWTIFEEKHSSVICDQIRNLIECQLRLEKEALLTNL